MGPVVVEVGLELSLFEEAVVNSVGQNHPLKQGKGEIFVSPPSLPSAASLTIRRNTDE